MNKFAIDVHHLQKNFGKLTAIRDLSLQIEPGTIFGVLGPNGSGKTTSLRLLCGLLKPDAGEGHCLGYDILTQTQNIQKNVGYSPQKFSLYGNMTVWENLDFIARIYGLRQRKNRLSEIVKKFALAPYRNHLAKTLSGGWQQRLALAAAILHKPKLLLLDEPTSGVDPQSRIHLWEIIQSIVNGGLTVLVSTHHMDEAERCHQLAYIAYGEMLAQGSVNDVIADTGLVTLQITGPKLSHIVSALKTIPEVLQVIERGHELRVSGQTTELMKLLRQQLDNGFEIQEIATSLEDIFIYKMRYEVENT